MGISMKWEWNLTWVRPPTLPPYSRTLYISLQSQTALFAANMVVVGENYAELENYV